MKILYIGQLSEGQTCRMRMEALKELGHDVVPYNTQAAWESIHWFSKHIQRRLSHGPVVSRLNGDIIALAREHKPDLMWCDKQEFLRPETLDAVRQLGGRTLHFTPDPYFTLSWKRTSLADACLPLFDITVCSKRYELEEYRRTCRQVIYTPLGFCDRTHRPTFPEKAAQRERYASEVAFLGGWEPRREHMLSAIATIGCNLKIWGYAWDHLVDGRWTLRRAYRLKINAGSARYRIHRNAAIAKAFQGGEVYGDEYAWALSGGRIGLGFLRHVCPDQHTTRTFEIPACGSMLLADRTEEHCEFFKEGREAEFFSSQDELVDKVSFYYRHEGERQRIAAAGRERCLRSGYSYRCRLRQIVKDIS